MNTPLNIIKYAPTSFIGYCEKILFNKPFCRWFEYIVRRKHRKTLKNIDQLGRILVVADYNIGDSVNILPAVEVLKKSFHNCQIDYVFNKKAASLVGNSNYINRAYPIFKGEKSFSKMNMDRFLNIITGKQYDLVFNFCPFFTDAVFKRLGAPVIHTDGLLVKIVKAVKNNKQANLSYNIVEYIKDIVNMLPNELKPNEVKFKHSGNKVFISKAAIQKKDNFINNKGFSEEDSLVYINPDSSNRYTFIRPKYYEKLAKRLLEGKYADGVILGQGYTFKTVEKEIYKAIPDKFKEKIFIHPDNCSLDFFAALVDICDIYVGSDTGPLHIASARKYTARSKDRLRNKTALISFFKATEPRIYGYDSTKAGFSDSHQDAPAKAFEAVPKCKNITCSIQKVIENCAAQKCSDNINIEKVLKHIKIISDTSQNTNL